MKWKKLVQAGHRLPLFQLLMLKGFAKDMKEQTGYSRKQGLFEIKNGVMTFYLPKEGMEEYNDHLIDAIKTDQNYIPDVLKKIVCNFTDLIAFCNHFKYMDMQKKSQEEITMLFSTFSSKFQKALCSYDFPISASKVLSNILIKELVRLNDFSDEQAQEYLQILSAPLEISDYKREYEHFLRIIIEINKHADLVTEFNKDLESTKDHLLRLYPKIDLMIDKHVEVYSYVPVHHAWNPPTKDFYLQQLKKELDSEVDKKLEEIEEYEGTVKKQKQEARR